MSLLAPTSSALVGLGEDSLRLFRPWTGTPIRTLLQPESYGVGFMEIGTRWVFLGENATWFSDDSGSHWTRWGIPGAGVAGRMLPTAQGTVMQDHSDREQGWISQDLATWSPFALPVGIRQDGLDTAASMLHAFTYGQLWTLEQNGWSRDSLTLQGNSGPVASVAWDGTKLWSADSKGLYSRTLATRIWGLVDSTPETPYPEALRYWKGALWSGGRSRDINGEMNVLASRSNPGGAWTMDSLYCGSVLFLAPTAQTLWIGTDYGLFRTNDGTRFEEVNPDPKLAHGIVSALAARGDTIAVSMADAYWLPTSLQHSISVSLDGGRTWTTDADQSATGFLIASQGVVAALSEGGLHRWSSTIEGVEKRTPILRDFVWRPGHLEWNAPDARTLEILDIRGRILSRMDVAPGLTGMALEPSSSLRVARLSGPHGTRTLAIPALR